MTASNRDVRFASKSGHVQCNSVCPLCANSGHQTETRYFEMTWNLFLGISSNTLKTEDTAPCR